MNPMEKLLDEKKRLEKEIEYYQTMVTNYQNALKEVNSEIEKKLLIEKCHNSI